MVLPMYMQHTWVQHDTSLWVYIKPCDSFIFLQVSNVCHFQELIFTITIQRVQPSHNTNSGDIVIGPETVRGQRMVHEVINSSLVVNAVYSVLVDMDTVTRSISAKTTFSKLPTVNYENTRKTYENWTPLGPQFTHSKVNYTIDFQPFMRWFFWYNYMCQRNFVHCSLKLLLLHKCSPNNCVVHCKLNFTSFVCSGPGGRVKCIRP